MGDSKFSFMNDHIVKTIQQTIKVTPPERQSQTLHSLLKKLLSNGSLVPAEIAASLPTMMNLNISADSLAIELKKHDENQMSLHAGNLKQVQSHETLLSPGKNGQAQRRDSMSSIT